MSKNMSLYFLILLSLFVVVQPTTEVWVSNTNGNDANDGLSISTPVKTLSIAQKIVRGLIPKSNGSVTVQIRGGTYTSTSFTKSPLLTLNELDSGLSENRRVIWQAYNNEYVLLSGGQAIDPLLFKPVPSTKRTPLGPIPSPVLQVNLTEALGSKWANVNFYGNLAGTTQLGACTNKNRMELFFNGKPLTLARFPNADASTGAFNWLGTSNVNNVTSSFMSNSTLSPERQAAWRAEANPWVHGYWTHNWADNYCKVQNVSNSRVFLDHSTPPLYGLSNLGRFYATNMLCELDAPGEYFVDVSSNILYFYPPVADITAPGTQITVSLSSNVISLGSSSSPTSAPVRFITFKSLHISYAQSVNFVSTSSVNNIQVFNCDLSNVGGSNLYISGTNNTIQGSTMFYAGCGANTISGGDTTTLSPSMNRAVNNTVMYYARFNRVYLPGFNFNGVGNIFSGNEIAFAPHQAFFGSGNDNIFEHNYVHNVVTETSDSGAWYMGRSWSYRGNVIRYNKFENIQRNVPGLSVKAVYFDDELSGNSVLNNQFISCDVGVTIGGGKDVIVTGNYFFKMSEYAVTIDNRGMTWQKSYCVPGGLLEQTLLQVNYLKNQAYWKYPYILDTMNNNSSCIPSHNVIANNTYCGFSTFLGDATPQNVLAWMSSASGNVLLCSSSPPPSPSLSPSSSSSSSSSPSPSPTMASTSSAPIAMTPTPPPILIVPTIAPSTTLPTPIPTLNGDTQVTLAGSLTLENVTASYLLADPLFSSAFSAATISALSSMKVVPSTVTVTGIFATTPAVLGLATRMRTETRYLASSARNGAQVKYSMLISMLSNTDYTTAAALSAAVSTGILNACSSGEFVKSLKAADSHIGSLSAASNVTTVTIESTVPTPGEAGGNESSKQPFLKPLTGVALYGVIAAGGLFGALVVAIICYRLFPSVWRFCTCKGGKVGLLPAGGTSSDSSSASGTGRPTVQLTSPMVQQSSKSSTKDNKIFYNPTTKAPDIRPSIFGSDDVYKHNNAVFGIDRLSVDM